MTIKFRLYDANWNLLGTYGISEDKFWEVKTAYESWGLHLEVIEGIVPPEPGLPPTPTPTPCIIATVFIPNSRFLPYLRLFRDKFVPKIWMKIYYKISIHLFDILHIKY